MCTKQSIPSSVFHITHCKNLSGIDEHGLLSRALARKMGLIDYDISDPSVQEKRKYPFFLASTETLHDFVPCFFNPRNAMLYKVMKRDGNQDQLVMLEVSIDSILDSRIAVTLGNAAAMGSSLYGLDFQEKLPWRDIMSDTWFDKGPEIKNWMMSEFLVFERISREHIQFLHYKNIIHRAFYNGFGFEAKLSPELFF